MKLQHKFIFLFFLVFTLSFVSAECYYDAMGEILCDGDANCLDFYSLCTSVFLMPDSTGMPATYCSQEDIIECSYGCYGGQCYINSTEPVETPECSDNYMKCVGNDRYLCEDNEWEYYDTCDDDCLFVSNIYSICSVVEETIPEETAEDYGFTEVYSWFDGELYSDGQPDSFYYNRFSHIYHNYNGFINGFAFWVGSKYGQGQCYKYELYVYDGLTTSDLIYTSDKVIVSYDDNLSYYEEVFIPFDTAYALTGDAIFKAVGYNQDDTVCTSRSPLYQYSGGAKNVIYEQSGSDFIVDDSYDYYNTSFSIYTNYSLNASIPDIYMSVDSLYSLNISDYYDSWDDFSVYLYEPTNAENIIIHTGYMSEFNDYFDVALGSNGLLEIYSYSRLYNGSFILLVDEGSSSSTQNISVFISGDNPSVQRTGTFQLYENLEYGEMTSFSGNQYYAYYDEIVFSIPITNNSGVLNSTFPFNWTIIENPSLSHNYSVNINCSVDDVSMINYSYSLDDSIKFDLFCRFGHSRIDFYYVSSYNQLISVNASNSVNYLTDFFYLLSGEYTSDYFPHGTSPSSNLSLVVDVSSMQKPEVPSSVFIVFYDKFSEFFPSDIPDSIKFVVSVIILFVVFFGVYFLSMMFKNRTLSLYLSSFSVFVVLSALVRFGYASAGWFVFLFTIILTYFFIKYLGGIGK